ncbi:MAG: Group intron-encoded protein LtrA [Planctomycetota bacterium]
MIHVSEKNVQKCKRRIRELTGRSRGIAMTQRFGELRRYPQGWAGYFALAKQMRLFENLDQWIRRRLRMCFWKRWRFVRTRVQNLLALGVPRRQAFRHAKSRHGPWHMAKTIASGVGMTNAWLQDQGLVSLKSLWVKRAPLRRTA